MKKINLEKIFSCTKCGAQTSKWSGRCLECGSWGTLEEEAKTGKELTANKLKNIPSAELIDFSKLMEKDMQRLQTDIEEFDRILGGGIVPGSLILLSGDPGIGKSTLIAQISQLINEKYSQKDPVVMYVSGEESASQLKIRFDRLNCDITKIACLTEINVEKIISTISKLKPKLVIIDSIQTLYSVEAESGSGSVTQIRACAAKLLEASMQNNSSIVLIGHITKDGAIAGPKSLEHIVDTVIYLESDPINNYRILRTTKNRFGSVNEVGIFEMTPLGLKEIKNPSAIFIEFNDDKITGSAISCVIEGTRPFLAEVQALVSKTLFGYPQRKASGFDLGRLQILTAVISKRTKANLNNQDVIINIAGGLKVSDPGLDLAVCSAIISSFYDKSLKKDALFIGEVGLGGEVRNVSKLSERVKEAEKLGFKSAIIPNINFTSQKLKLIKIKNLEELINVLK